MLKWIMTFLSISMLGGRLPNIQPCHVVTEISVQWQENGRDTYRIYTEQEKMNRVLLYLRSLEPNPTTETPDASREHLYEIRVKQSDGSITRYRQQGSWFFQETSACWQAIDPNDAIHLPLILAAVPSDF